ncbi:hypothetical protein NKH77_38730 [Streptomyces sp. M19]
MTRLRRVYQQAPATPTCATTSAAPTFSCSAAGTAPAAPSPRSPCSPNSPKAASCASARRRALPHGHGALEKGHGYLLELPDDQAAGAAGTAGTTGTVGTAGTAGRPEPTPPTRERGLERLREVLTEREAYAVVLVADGDLADRLLYGRRHALPYRPPAADRVLDRHLTALLAAEPDGMLAAARAAAASRSVRAALGLEEPLPGEAARLARLLAGHVSGGCRASGCSRTAASSRRSRPATGPGPRAVRHPARRAAALRAAGLRIALAALGGTALSVVAEAAELLTWELAVTLDPLYAPGARCSGRGPRTGSPRYGRGWPTARRTSATRPYRCAWRASRGRGWRPRCCTRRGTGTTTSAARWGVGCARCATTPAAGVGAGGGDGRRAVRPRPLYGTTELLLPLARTDSPVQRMAAATALAEASRAPARDRPWRTCCGAGCAAPTRGAADRGARARPWPGGGLGRRVPGRTGPGRLPGRRSARLLQRGAAAGRARAGHRAGPARHMAAGGNRARADLALLTTVRALATRTSRLWGPPQAPEHAPWAAWPLAAALLSAGPEREEPLAELVRAALVRNRTATAAQDALVSWVRRAADDRDPVGTRFNWPCCAGFCHGWRGGRPAARRPCRRADSGGAGSAVRRRTTRAEDMRDELFRPQARTRGVAGRCARTGKCSPRPCGRPTTRRC